MKIKRALTRAPRMVGAVALVAALAGGAVALTGGAAGAATLTGSTITVSNNAANVVNPAPTVNTAVYTWSFTTVAASVAYTKLTFTVPTGTLATGSLTVPTLYGITGCSSETPSLTATTVTVLLSGCSATPASTLVQISVSKLKNGTTVGAISSTITTYSGTPTFTKQDTGVATGASLANNTTAVTISVPDSLTFSNSNTSVTMLPIPGGATVTAPNVTLTVGTNAKGGYTLAACVLSTIKGTTNTTATIGQLASVSATLPATASNFGAKPAVTGTGATLSAGWTAGSYLGYNSTCGTTTHSVIMKSTVPVATNKLTLTNGVRVKSLQPADKYTGTITYQVTPSY